MNPDFLLKIKGKLNEERTRLTRDLKDLGWSENTGGEHLAYPESGGNSDDDNAMEVTELADEVSLVERLKNELRDTEKALAAIDKGAYGICKYCGKEIDEKRLLARPISSSCIECKKTLTQEL